MARQETANELINRAALQIGLTPVADPVASTEEAFVQLTGLLNACGQELVELHEWQVLRQIVDFTVDENSSATQLSSNATVGPGAEYDLPDDYSYMFDQTHWDRTNSLPVGGPLSAQNWTHIEGRDLVGSTIYLDFRIAENKLFVFPTTVPDGARMSFEYISRYWVQTSGGSAPDTDKVTAGSDTVLYEPVLVVKFLRAKYLEAKGLDARKANIEFDTIFYSRTGKDKGAPILNAAGSNATFPYLNPFRNLGDTGYGV